MVDALKVMILEDRKQDQELVKRQVLKYNPKSVFLIAENKHTFTSKIEWFVPDIILADYNLPDYTGLEALLHVKEYKPTVPFIFVTGGLHKRDLIAADILKGADGFVLKDDLQTLHIRLAEIVENLQAKIKLNASVAVNKIELKMRILKAISMLSDADDFSHKETVMEILRSLSADFMEK